ncbi:hypothetical protein Cni_G13079 [Canna indica]|uniref:Uncharacterized protein n=1 Tax=Canna indica TaxID=4628 RepID=A0AAQ3KBW7_9LILI|nr:hypothetical protein Cni_G13079 [Canna indica]
MAMANEVSDGEEAMREAAQGLLEGICRQGLCLLKNDAVDFHRLSYSGGNDEDAVIGSPINSDLFQCLCCFGDDAQKSNRKRHFFEPHHFVLNCHECSVREILLPCKGQTAALADITKLIDSDLSKSRKEWSQFEHEITEAGVEIEHIIFEEIRDKTLLEILF